MNQFEDTGDGLIIRYLEGIATESDKEELSKWIKIF